VVPFGQVVPASCSTNTCVPLIAALVQQPWITPEESTGPAIAAPAVVPPASSTSPAPTLIKVVRNGGRLIAMHLISRVMAAVHSRSLTPPCGTGISEMA